MSLRPSSAVAIIKHHACFPKQHSVSLNTQQQAVSFPQEMFGMSCSYPSIMPKGTFLISWDHGKVNPFYSKPKQGSCQVNKNVSPHQRLMVPRPFCVGAVHGRQRSGQGSGQGEAEDGTPGSQVWVLTRMIPDPSLRLAHQVKIQELSKTVRV